MHLFAPARARRWSVSALLAVSLLLSTLAGLAEASHFRFGHVTWTPQGGNTIQFTVTTGWRRSAFAGPPVIGSVINVGTFAFGDGGTASLSSTVTSVDPAADWFLATATVSRTYANPGSYVAHFSSCCRLSGCSNPNAHPNNPDASWRVESLVQVGAANSSPVSSLPPIVNCPQNGLCLFQIPASDNESAVTFRMSTLGEAAFSRQPGAPGNGCTGGIATINAGTGLYSWDTSGCATAATQCGQPSWNTLYSTQVMLEDANGARSALDFLIQLVDNACAPGNVAPTFQSPACNSTVSTAPGSPVGFNVQASDANLADTVALQVGSLPSGASHVPALPTVGNPASTTFSWTPTLAQVGQHVITYTATDDCGAQTLCSITIDVNEEDCNNGLDDDGDTLIDNLDPDCQICGDGDIDVNEQCDDGNVSSGDGCSAACTLESVCGNGQLEGVEDCDDGNLANGDCCADDCTFEPAGSPCDDGAFCTAPDVCDGAGVCSPGAPLVCDDGVSCTTDETCNEATDACDVTPSDALCDDAQYCNGVEICDVQNDCQPGTPVTCPDDGFACTIESCNEGLDQCSTENTCVCDNGIVEPGEECEPVNPEDCNNMTDDDGDGRVDCADSDCADPLNPKVGVVTCGEDCMEDPACARIERDPATIRWGRDGLPDRLFIHGRFRLQSDMNPLSEEFAFQITNEHGAVYRASLGAGGLAGKVGGKRFKYVDKAARLGAGVNDGLSRVGVKIVRSRGIVYLSFKVIAYADFSAATVPLMATQIAVGNDIGFLEAEGTASSKGWTLRQRDY